MTGDEKIDRLRAVVSLLREHSTEPQTFAAIEALASTDAKWLAGRLGPMVGKNADNPQIGDVTIGIVAQFLDDRQDLLRRDGTPEAELSAYVAIVSLGVAEAFGGFQADLRDAERVGRH